MHRGYSILIVPARGARHLSLSFSPKTTRILLWGIACLATVSGLILGDYLWMKARKGEVERLMAKAQTQQEELSAVYKQTREIEKLLDQWKGLRKKLEASLPTNHRPSTNDQKVVEGLKSSLGLLQSELQRLIASTPSEWPVRGRVSSGVGNRLDPWTGEPEFHAGLDIPEAIGTPVRAAADGTVNFSGNRKGGGQVVVLDHGQGIVTKYAHLSRIHVKKGQTVRKGEEIAAVGNTGKSTSPHLHYELRLNGIPVDPRRQLLQSRGSPESEINGQQSDPALRHSLAVTSIR